MTTRRRARCLIVDDEAPARAELRFLLEGFAEDVQVVGEASNADEAAVLLASVDYDLVLLDIRMPGGTGLDLTRTLRERPDPPAVVFTTAYPDHAVEAFDLAAADYLVKPFDSDRLERALRRALRAPAEDEVASATSDTPGAATQRIPVQQAGRTVLISPSAIYYASAARGYSYLKLSTERLLTTYTLAELERRLGADFFRVHRSYLVSLRHVRELVADFQGSLAVVMDDAERSRVEVSRRQAAALRRALGL